MFMRSRAGSCKPVYINRCAEPALFRVRFIVGFAGVPVPPTDERVASLVGFGFFHLPWGTGERTMTYKTNRYTTNDSIDARVYLPRYVSAPSGPEEVERSYVVHFSWPTRSAAGVHRHDVSCRLDPVLGGFWTQQGSRVEFEPAWTAKGRLIVAAWGLLGLPGFLAASGTPADAGKD